jgi:thymidylate synthase (FAD)
MNVELIDNMGSDLSVVNAARVSFDKGSDWNYWNDDGKVKKYMKPKDVKLIEYLAKNKHWSPFSHPQIQFRIKAPIFVARQLGKHQVGLAWNEISRRYVDTTPEFFFPEVWRKYSEDKKQGSSNEIIDINPKNQMVDPYESSVKTALWTYNYLLEKGVCPEQARMVLPQAAYTQWFWTGSLYAFSRICNLRMAKDSQEETREIAKGIDKHCKKLYPVSWEALRRSEG